MMKLCFLLAAAVPALWLTLTAPAALHDGASRALQQASSAGQASAQKQPLSPPEQASVVLNGKRLTIDYSAPSVRGRKVMGELVPYGQVWRTGANAATTLHTQSSLRIDDLIVPEGEYTLYTIPSDMGWTLIINRQTGQPGTEYNKAMDLGRVPMLDGVIPSHLQEQFEIGFENTEGKSTEMHLVWEDTDVYVPMVAID
jgi:hypothetical protein